MKIELTRKEVINTPLGTLVFVMDKKTGKIKEYLHCMVGTTHTLINHYGEYRYTLITLFHAFLDNALTYNNKKRIWTEEYNEEYAMRRFKQLEEGAWPYKFYVKR